MEEIDLNATLEKENLHTHPEFAGFWIRFAAYLIDSLIVGIPLAMLGIVIFMLSLGTSDAVMILLNDPYIETLTAEQEMDLVIRYIVSLFAIIAISYIVSIAYFAGLHASKWQGTVGKKLLGLKVSDIQGRKISFWRALGRYAAMSFLSGILLIGYIIAAFTEKKQALHDLIAGTVEKNRNSFIVESCLLMMQYSFHFFIYNIS